jgi:hypothetical protein
MDLADHRSGPQFEPSRCGWPPKIRPGDIGASPERSPAWAEKSPGPPYGRSLREPASTRAPAQRSNLG